MERFLRCGSIETISGAAPHVKSLDFDKIIKVYLVLLV